MWDMSRNCKQTIQLDKFRGQLIQQGYRFVEQVSEHSERLLGIFLVGLAEFDMLPGRPGRLIECLHRLERCPVHLL